MRQIVLDTETTGLEPGKGHRVIEIGCVELLERRPSGRTFHVFLNPDRAVDEGARAVHGIGDDFLRDKPRFAEIAEEFVAFVEGAEIIAHNASFDAAFLDAELGLAGPGFRTLRDYSPVLDTLQVARQKYPGQQNSLNALCKRLGVDNRHRELHGALVDAYLLADVYLAMTAGQGDLGLAVKMPQASQPSCIPFRRERIIARGAGGRRGNGSAWSPLASDRKGQPRGVRLDAARLERIGRYWRIAGFPVCREPHRYRGWRWSLTAMSGYKGCAAGRSPGSHCGDELYGRCGA